MTRVDFYVLDSQAPGARQGLACRLADKAWQAGHRVYIHTESESEAARLDEMLWTFRDQSFIPHGRLGQADPQLNPVLVGCGNEPDQAHDVLINLCQEVPTFFSHYQRVIEPVDKQPEALAASRERYRFYRDRGYPLDNHPLAR